MGIKPCASKAGSGRKIATCKERSRNERKELGFAKGAQPNLQKWAQGMKIRQRYGNTALRGYREEVAGRVLHPAKNDGFAMTKKEPLL